MMAMKKSLVLGTVIAVAGCLTVNVYFPAPEVRDAAEQIVEETWGDGSADDASAPGETVSWWRLLQPAVAHAAEPGVDIDVSTAAIRKLKAAMSERAEQLKPHLRTGAVGIANSGLLAVRDLAGVGLRDRAEVQRWVDAENRDRLALYQEIARANDLGKQEVPRIQKIFAETWIEKAEAKWWVQSKDGDWAQR